MPEQVSLCVRHSLKLPWLSLNRIALLIASDPGADGGTWNIQRRGNSSSIYTHQISAHDHPSVLLIVGVMVIGMEIINLITAYATQVEDLSRMFTGRGPFQNVLWPIEFSYKNSSGIGVVVCVVGDSENYWL